MEPFRQHIGVVNPVVFAIELALATFTEWMQGVFLTALAFQNQNSRP